MRRRVRWAWRFVLNHWLSLTLFAFALVFTLFVPGETLRLWLTILSGLGLLLSLVFQGKQW